jgi:hypothetical protein
MSQRFSRQARIRVHLARRTIYAAHASGMSARRQGAKRDQQGCCSHAAGDAVGLEAPAMDQQPQFPD